MIYLAIGAGVVVVIAITVFAVAANDVHICARRGKTERLRVLLAKDPALLEAADEDGETPAHHAAKYGRTETLTFLLDRGAKLHARSKIGVTLLHYAAVYGHLATVKLLLERGAEVDAREETGMTPLNAAQAGDHLAIIDVLIQAGADPNAIPALIEMGDSHFMSTTVRDDDPLMVEATGKARETLPVMRQLFAEHRGSTEVKFAFTCDSGEVEHIWASVIELGDDHFKARIRTPPARHQGKLEAVQHRPIGDIEDWQVTLPDNNIRGGFGYHVVFQRTREQLGKLPLEFEAVAGRFLDHPRNV